MAEKGSRWSFTTLLNFKGKVRRKPAAGHVRDTNPYHAVSILPGKNACDAVFRFSGRRYLSRQAPRLPLPACDAFNCTCRFKHHKDRRAGPRRTSDIGLITVMWNGPERRRAGGRRTTD
jgi:hypothetical protein